MKADHIEVKVTLDAEGALKIIDCYAEEVRKIVEERDDLLKALQAMLTTWEHGSVDAYPVAQARAAIAKATGETQ